MKFASRPAISLAFAFAALLGSPSVVSAQAVVAGVVLSEDGTVLPAATVQIEGTYIGTVANGDGRFSIEVPSFPATLIFRFIGYQTERVTVSRPDDNLTVRLPAEPFVLPGITVSSEDPAVEIMRRVIARKRQMRDSLRTFEADAYNRFTLENDTGVVSVVEGLSRFYWDRDRGAREVVLGSRQTANLAFEGLMPAALLITNLYDDEIDVGGHTLKGVTHPDAVDHYNFRLEGTTQQDGREVYSIYVETKGRLSTGFEGLITVADRDFVLLSVDLRPNDTFLFPPPIQFFEVSYRQQFLPYGEGQWLPADFRSELNLKVGLRTVLTFPAIRIRQSARLSGYRVNTVLPDSLYESEDVVRVDSASTAMADSLLDAPGLAVPLTERESLAYSEIDSTMTLEEAFEPGGVVGRAARLSIRLNGGDDSDRSAKRSPDSTGAVGKALGKLDISPRLQYNRVEGFSPAIEIGVGNRMGPRFRFGRAFGLEETFLGYGVEVNVGQIQVRADRDDRIRSTYDSWTRSGIENSFAFAIGRKDYFDYYQSERLRLSVTRKGKSGSPTIEVGVQYENVLPVPTTTTWQLQDLQPVALNPYVAADQLGSVTAKVFAGTRPDPFLLVGSTWGEAELEVGRAGLFGGDRSFARGRIRGTLRLNTFYKDRLIPQALDLHVALGLSNGALPAARWWTVDGSNNSSRPGSFRTLEGRPYQGDHAALVGWEHHFRTVPFERLGWDWAVRRGLGIIAFGAHGRTWISDDRAAPEWRDLGPAPAPPLVPDAWHHEVGLSLNGLFDLFRIDVAHRLDASDWAVGFGVARHF